LAAINGFTNQVTLNALDGVEHFENRDGANSGLAHGIGERSKRLAGAKARAASCTKTIGAVTATRAFAIGLLASGSPGDDLEVDFTHRVCDKFGNLGKVVGWSGDYEFLETAGARSTTRACSRMVLPENSTSALGLLAPKRTPRPPATKTTARSGVMAG
jgi:hypothetical protein